ncbi:MAG: glycosyltransferase family 2 protein [Pseudomonadales bacterium]|nr:glycosyltransferase family 2 protein [Pseudomonadales bacterium]
MISVVTVSYHTGPVLFNAIASVLEQPGLHEFILVDNGNSAAFREEISARFGSYPNFRQIINDRNLGFSAACNQGAAIATGNILLFLNPDCILLSDSLQQLQALADRLPEHAMIGADLRGTDNLPQRGARRNLPTPWLTLVELFRLDKLAPKHPYFRRINRQTEPVPVTEIEVPAISGAFMAMKRTDFLEVGQFDENYFLHVEDLDLCYRWQQLGWKTWFAPQLRVMHLLSTSDVSPLFIEQNKTRGLIRYFTTHFSPYYPAAMLWLLSASLTVRYIGRWVEFYLRPRWTAISIKRVTDHVEG